MRINPKHLIPIVVLILAYVATQHFHLRRDLTDKQLFTLNQATLDILDDLEDPLHIRMYFSEELPPRFRPVFQYIQTMVAQYVAHGNGKVIVTYIDPAADLEMVDAAHKIGIYETKANVTEKSRVEMTYIWFGMAVLYRDQKRIFSSVTAIEEFEFTLTEAIMHLTRVDKPKVTLMGPTWAEDSGFVFDIDHNINPLYQKLSDLYEVSQIRIEPGLVPDLEDAGVLFAWGVHDYDEAQRFALDQHLMKGRPLVLLTNGIRINPVSLQATPVPEGPADQMFMRYGFRVSRNLIADTTNTKIKYTDVKPPVLKDYPLFPALYKERSNLDSKYEPTASLESLIVPWASSIEPAVVENIVFRTVARSSNQSWPLTDTGFSIDPDRVPGPQSFDSYVLGATLTGPHISAFDAAPDGGPHIAKAPDETTIYLWGSEHLLTQSQNASIPTWALETAGYLTGARSLASIDRRENAFRPTRAMHYEEKVRYKWLSVTIAPGIVVLLALIFFLIRRGRNLNMYLTAE